MRRLSTVVQLCGWRRQLKFVASYEIGSRIQQEVQQAISRFRSKSHTPWVAISRVSSVLREDTQEALAELGGLACFCRNPPEDSGSAPFVVKMVDGVLCVRSRVAEVSNAPKPRKGSLAEVCTDEMNVELTKICSNIPETPVTLETCQRVWGLPTLEMALEKVNDVMKEIERVLRRDALKLCMGLYLQVVYFGKQIVIAVRGPKTMLATGSNTKIENAKLQWQSEDFAPHYDLWRLSRFLRTDSFIPCGELIKQTTGILQTPLLQIALTYPERISLQLGPAIHLEKADDGRFYINGALHNEIHEVIGVKFILSEEEVQQHLTKTSSKLADLSDEQLQEERRKLKELMPMRRQKIRRSIVREEFRRKYPKGNPFLNPDVVAILLYDSMAPGVWMNNAMVREVFLPGGGKDSMHVGVDFFDKYPHLFITQGITSTSVNVMRREQGMEDVHSDGDAWKNGVFTEEDILLFLLPRLTNKRDDWGDTKAIDILLSLLPRHVFKYMQSNGCARRQLATILQRYPEAFDVQATETEDGMKGEQQFKVRLVYDAIVKLGVQLVNKMQVPGNGQIVTGENSQESGGDHDHNDDAAANSSGASKK